MAIVAATFTAQSYASCSPDRTPRSKPGIGRAGSGVGTLGLPCTLRAGGDFGDAAE
jgi:hypothetical protein